MTIEPTLVQLGAVGVGIVLLLTLVAVAALRKARARRARPTDEPVSESTVDEPASESTPDEPASESTPDEPVSESVDALTDPLPDLVAHDETVVVRALRAQVRALEQALEALPAAVMAAPAPQAAAEEEPAAAYRRQVALTIRALAGREDQMESTQRTLARVAAAIERLDAPVGLTRPAIPALAVRAARPIEAPVDGPSTWAPASLRSLASVVEPTTPAEEAVPAASPEESREVDGAATMVEPVDQVELERQLVLPVPPPAPAQPKRSKRRLRRNAA